ncbi:MAG: RNA polymerase subunit sigma-70 [Gemmatimonadetes bacterium]|nr:MAG: RNA polymerase subunit sigma-70 [Gemmatimonadota bacterium]
MEVTDADAAARAAERVARDSYGRLVAFLAARTRDVASAEDALGEAFAAALRVWPTDGVPANPDAWILTVARRRQTDSIRRRETRTAAEAHMRLVVDEIVAAAGEPESIPDRRLALMFACAHPAIERGARAPLMLQTILGLTAEEIAAAFLVPPAAMGQRLVRAKTRIRDTGIPFRVPEKEELAERLESVLDAIYAAYSKGWNEVGDAGAPEIAEEAVWLGWLVVSLLPDEPEAKGMLALMLYAESRRSARHDATGAYVPLDEQDTRLWDGSQIAIAEKLLREASRSGPTGRYQLEAAIQSAHTARRMTGVANWPIVVALYDHLLALTSSPVVALNRAVALAEVEGADAALSGAMASLANDKRMLGYQPYWAARGHLLARLGRTAEAGEAFTVAIGLTTDEAARAYLQRQLAELQQS